jgi:hypothetical protein
MRIVVIPRLVILAAPSVPKKTEPAQGIITVSSKENPATFD